MALIAIISLIIIITGKLWLLRPFVSESGFSVKRGTMEPGSRGMDRNECFSLQPVSRNRMDA
jgi:hypothetical protein